MAVVILLLTTIAGFTQEVDDIPEDSIPTGSLAFDSIFAISNDVEPLIEGHSTDSLFADSLQKQLNTIVEATLPLKVKKDWSTWKPDPKRALWLAIVFPGGGQIYNRKYWKLPLIYGGFMGCLYAMNWNNTMYKDYSQAYLDLMDNDPGTQSYNQFLHLGTTINDSNKERFVTLFKKRKDRYRRWRDMSFFVLVGVYALSVVDAYVDAELSVFDISKDLSLKIEPTILNDHTSNNPLNSASLGVQCSLNF